MTRRPDDVPDDLPVDATELLRTAGDAIVAGVERDLAGYLDRYVARVLDAWGRLDPPARQQADGDVRAASTTATTRVVAELRALFAVDPGAQRKTPLQVVRGGVREPTQVLAGLGVPPVARDEFAERSWPDDVYGLVPHMLADLGDPELGPLHLAWGMAKTRVLRERAADRDR